MESSRKRNLSDETAAPASRSEVNPTTLKKSREQSEDVGLEKNVEEDATSAVHQTSSSRQNESPQNILVPTDTPTNYNCAICLEPNIRGQLKQLVCSHTFHEACIDRWLNSRAHCPICRKVITTLGNSGPSDQTVIYIRRGRVERQRVQEIIQRVLEIIRRVEEIHNRSRNFDLVNVDIKNLIFYINDDYVYFQLM